MPATFRTPNTPEVWDILADVDVSYFVEHETTEYLELSCENPEDSEHLKMMLPPFE